MDANKNYDISYYITSSYKGLYIKFSYSGKLETTEIFEEANFFKTQTEASKILVTMPKKLKKLSSGWEVKSCYRAIRENSIEYISDNNILEEKNTDRLVFFEFLNIDTKLDDIQKLKEQIEYVYNNHARYADLLELYNRQQCDLLHKIEDSHFNACEGYKLAKQIKNVREKRRQVKNALRFIEKAQGSLDIDIIISEIKAIKEQKYRPRALPELFEEV